MSEVISLGARARGLSLHLLSRAELEQLAGSDEAGLARALAATSKLVVPPAERAGAVELDVAVQQTLARRLATLRRWGEKEPVLEVFEAAADLRSLRALVRGAAQGAPAAQRLAGLVPTRTLPLKLLEVLSRQPTAARVAAHLFATGHPDGARLSALTHAKTAPELLALDHALVRGFAERAGAAAIRDPELRGFVALQLDVSNVATARVLAGARDENVRRWFVAGGECLTQDEFAAAASKLDVAQATAALERALAKTGARRLFRLAGGTAASAATLELAAFRLALARVRRAARLEPLGTAPALLFLLRLEAMARDVRRVVHGVALGAPKALLLPDLVTP